MVFSTLARLLRVRNPTTLDHTFEFLKTQIYWQLAQVYPVGLNLHAERLITFL